MPYTKYGYLFVDLNELILNIYIFCKSLLSGNYGFTVAHGNYLKVTIFSLQRLGTQNKKFIQNQLVQTYKMVPIFSILCHFLKIRLFRVNTFRGKTQIGSWQTQNGNWNLNELILNIYFILNSETPLGIYRVFQVITVYHGHIRNNVFVYVIKI